MTAWLPWWAASLVLGGVTVASWLAARRPLGVAGVLGRFAALGEERRAERTAAALRADRAALEAQLLAATAEALASGELRARPAGEADVGPAHRLPARPPGRALGPMPPLSAHAAFLAALAAGGLLARLVAGGPPPESGIPPGLAAHVGQAGGLAALLAGGALAGFGAAASGGCTAGHGLTGCARLSPASLVATAVFLAAAVGTSLLLGWLP